MLRVSIRPAELRIGSRLAISLHRTLRVPDDGRRYPLPPTLGAFELRPVGKFAKKLPAEIAKSGGAFAAIHNREALWIFFEGTSWKPNAVQIEAGGVNAVTGEPFGGGLSGKPQNYVVAPLQPWLDGFKSADGVVRQFVAAPLGAADAGGGGLRFRVFEPKPGIFPARAPANAYAYATRELPPMGLGAGGAIEQKIYPDPHGVPVWDQRNSGDATVHLLHPRDYERVTGEAPPATPIDAATYTKHGLPWFEIYDDRADLSAAERLRRVRPV